MKDIQENLVNVNATLRDVLTTLNKGVYGVVLIVDDSGIMKGMFTDGDVRRALLNGAVLSEPVKKHMNSKFVFGKTSMSHEENLRLLYDKIRHIPVLDDQGKPCGLLSWAELWQLPVMRPSLGGNELKYLSDCISSNWISSQGHYIKQFEEIFSEFLSVEHSIATSFMGSISQG